MAVLSSSVSARACVAPGVGPGRRPTRARAVVPGGGGEATLAPTADAALQDFLSAEVSARHRFDARAEAALNAQINVEYTASYTYHALWAYFDRDDVALKGIAEFFKKESEEEREHAEKLMAYQTRRGGRVALQALPGPALEMPEPGKSESGVALPAFVGALALEKYNMDKLLELHEVADACGDIALADYIEGEFLQPQVESIKEYADMVAQLRTAGPGLGELYFSQNLEED